VSFIAENCLSDLFTGEVGCEVVSAVINRVGFGPGEYVVEAAHAFEAVSHVVVECR